jgi:peptide/nickel transport system permease protein
LQYDPATARRLDAGMARSANAGLPASRCDVGADLQSAREVHMSQVLPGGAEGTVSEESQNGQVATAQGPPEAPVKRIEGRTPGQLALARLRQDRVAVASFVFIVLLILVAVFAPLLVKLLSHPPNDTSHYETMTNSFGAPKGPNFGLHFWFGADQFGRDLFSRVLYGARVSLIVGIVATGLALAIGVVVGMLAGFYRGWIDTGLSRLMDILLSIPFLLLALALVSVFRPSLGIIIVVIAFVSWTYIARIVRGQVLSLREKEFVEASRSLGASNLRIIFRDILPNLTAPIIIYATLIIPANILTEAYLSFLGLGVPPPTATWGQMLADSNDFYQVAWWMVVFPGMALLFTTLAFNLLGDGLRDAFDPRGNQTSGRL